jgi:hypothetical protein
MNNVLGKKLKESTVMTEALTGNLTGGTEKITTACIPAQILKDSLPNTILEP